MALNRRLATSLLGLAAVLPLILASLLSPPEFSRPWRGGWRMLLIGSGTNPSELMTWLHAWGVKRIVNRAGQETEIADYSGRILSMPLLELAARLPAGDPRRDEWTEGLAAWFSGKYEGQDREIWYFRADPRVALFPGSFEKGLEGRGVVEVASEISRPFPGGWALRLALVILGTAPSLMLKGRRRRISLVASLPWLGYVALGPGAAAALALAGAGASPLVITIFGSRNGPGGGAWLDRARKGMALALLPLFSAVLLASQAMPAFLCLALSSVFLGALAERDASSSVRRAFVAVPILGRKRSVARPSREQAGATLGVILLSVVPLVLSPGSANANMKEAWLPLPSSPSSSSSQATTKMTMPLPDLSAWKGHVENEAAFFNRAIRIQEEDAPALAGDRPEAIAWPTGIPKSPSKNGIEGLLADQGRGARFAYASPANVGRAPLALWRVILYIIASIVVLVAAGRPRLVDRQRTDRHP